MDSTLREGLQGPGFYLNNIQKCRILNGLNNANVTFAEVASHDRDFLRFLVHFKHERQMNIRLVAWSRLKREEIIETAALKPDEINVSIPVSSFLRSIKLKKSESQIFADLEWLGAWLQKRNIPWALGMEDASRAERSEIEKFAGFAYAQGAKRIRFADTLGLMDPFSVYEELNYFTRKIPCDWEFHGHDDQGLVLANSRAAVKAGASMVSGTLAGVGERVGNLRTEEFSMVLSKNLLGLSSVKPSKLKAERLDALAGLMAKWAGRSRSSWRPFFGEALHRHSSGTHVAALLKDRSSYEPSSTNKKNLEIWPGPESGRAALKYAANLEGWNLDDTEAEHLRLLMTRRFAKRRGEDVWKVFKELLLWTGRRQEDLSE